LFFKFFKKIKEINMKTNKFKLLSIAICCLIPALWSGIQCMEDQIKNDVPAGSICSFAGEKAPNGWLLCDGAQYSSREYPRLYEVVKTKYVPAHEELRVLRFNADNDYKLFYVPDLRGRVIVGIDGGAGRVTSNNTLGASGGEEKHQLTVDELASHSHTTKFKYDKFYAQGTYRAIWDQATDSNVTIGSTGGDKPHNNMQPYQVLNYIINVGRNDRFQDEIQQLKMEIKELKIGQQGCAKAWVVFDGSGNILDGYGISSVSKHAPGLYVINFLKQFKTKNYCFSLGAWINSCTLAASSYYAWPQTASSFSVLTYKFDTGAHMDALTVSACFYGNQ
jgi:microcystin-dependent protein